MATRSIRSAVRQRILETDKRAIRELRAELNPIAGKLKRKHEKVVKSWQHKPKFGQRVLIERSAITVKVHVSGQHKDIYRYVDEGTRPHVIAPRTADGRLVFQGGYNAKTAPVAKFNQGDGGRTGDWASVQIVNHPGTEPREFSQTFSDEIRPDFEQAIENALRRAIRRNK